MEFVDLVPNICKGLPFKKGDSVLLNFWGDNEDLKILDLISKNLSEKGIIPIPHHLSKKFFHEVILNLINNNEIFNDEYFKYLSSFESVMDIFMYTPSLPEGILEKDIPIFKEYLGRLFNSLTEDKKYYIQITVPTEINAHNAGLDYDFYNKHLCNALSVDFPQLKNECKNQVEKLKNKNNVEIITGGKYSLNLNISNRKWFVDDGNGDFPPGEIFIAPIENDSNGDILITMVNLRGEIYKNVVMTFKNGRLIKCSVDELNDFFNSLPENYRILCELGIGLNPKVKDLTGIPFIDEKALGSYHIGIGMNHLFGGENNCPFHMDFVFYCDEISFN